MNANSPLQTPAIDSWLKSAVQQLQAADIESARLDAEIILAHTIRKSRTYIHAHGDESLAVHHKEIADARLQLRADRLPIAYIIGHKEFFGRQYKVTNATLIPRPESEDIIEILKESSLLNRNLLGEKRRLVDVGTGTGCLGISAKLELPDIDVTLIDVSNHALNVAKSNAAALRAEVTLLRNDLLRGLHTPYDVIIANLPYVDRSWDVSPETQAEPDIALFASHGGLNLIDQLIVQTDTLLVQGGTLLLEADVRQHEAIKATCKTHGLQLVQIRGYILHFTKL